MIRKMTFNVISYPFLDGNIPENLSYGIFTSQLVRFLKQTINIKGLKTTFLMLYKESLADPRYLPKFHLSKSSYNKIIQKSIL